mmetsp:Transcript_1011/g.2363  ORF Transcript_1011/g.2363 Transcript_1011/m.2363 type:complete len:483 (-) Transcript_1011:65-1513(-)
MNSGGGKHEVTQTASQWRWRLSGSAIQTALLGFFGALLALFLVAYMDLGRPSVFHVNIFEQTQLPPRHARRLVEVDVDADSSGPTLLSEDEDQIPDAVLAVVEDFQEFEAGQSGEAGEAADLVESAPTEEEVQDAKMQPENIEEVKEGEKLKEERMESVMEDLVEATEELEEVYEDEEDEDEDEDEDGVDWEDKEEEGRQARIRKERDPTPPIPITLIQPEKVNFAEVIRDSVHNELEKEKREKEKEEKKKSKSKRDDDSDSWEAQIGLIDMAAVVEEVQMDLIPGTGADDAQEQKDEKKEKKKSSYGRVGESQRDSFSSEDFFGNMANTVVGDLAGDILNDLAADILEDVTSDSSFEFIADAVVDSNANDDGTDIEVEVEIEVVKAEDIFMEVAVEEREEAIVSEVSDKMFDIISETVSEGVSEVDVNGEENVEQLSHTLELFGFDLSKSELGDLFEAADADGSMTVDANELENLVRDELV